jgi:NAD(P)-dependent dehydrogenase (short-subunit alcohol dehydrogenase family)
MNVNVRGTFLLMREVYPHMKKRRDGRIVNFSSTAGLTASTLGGAHYTASKHAVMGLTKAVAKEGGPFGVRVNAVCPGLIDTEMVRGTIDKKIVKQYERSFPISRLGTPEEVAELVLFLASDKSAYVTGVGVNISGGDLL